MENYKKSEWKKLVKENIQRKVEESKEKINEVKKLKRQKQQRFERQNYVKEKKLSEATEIMKTKLEMWDIGKSIGSDRECMGCEEQEDIEHVIECQQVKRIVKRDGEKKWLESNNERDMEELT